MWTQTLVYGNNIVYKIWGNYVGMLVASNIQFSLNVTFN
jgi:hypothetical protein